MRFSQVGDVTISAQHVHLLSSDQGSLVMVTVITAYLSFIIKAVAAEHVAKCGGSRGRPLISARDVRSVACAAGDSEHIQPLLAPIPPTKQLCGKK
jgi:hypothetical protein